MSGLAGLCRPQGPPPALGELERMAAALAHRGPDGSAIWRSTAVGLGCLRLYTTPESNAERLPLVLEEAGLALVADARLDNRADLLAALGWQGRRPERIGDGELILDAYRKWGERCPEKLLGDFAFAIWDEGSQQLFCARDPFGVRPFYYGIWGGGLYFASEIKALLALPGAPRRLNETRVGDYLAGMLDDPSATFYRDILRLPAAHCLAFGTEGLRLRRYYELDPARELGPGADGEYAGAFRELFVQAVACRLRGASPAGVLLSGGLDSSSIACTARQALAARGERLLAFSNVFEESAHPDERPFIRAILDQGGFEPHWVNGDRTGPLAGLEDLFRQQDEPFYAPNLAISCELRACVRAHGVRVLLDGHDGDTTVSHGEGYLKELARAGRWPALAGELRGLSRMYGEPYGPFFWQMFRAYELAPRLDRSPALRLARRFYRKARRTVEQPPQAERPGWARYIRPDFARRIELGERRRAWRGRLPEAAPTEREQHHRALSSGLQSFALEVLDRAAAPFGIEPRYPFWDRRLVEFCLALPPEQKLRHGWSRLVLRQAMSGILSPAVQWRRDKWNFFPVFARGLRTLERGRIEDLLRHSGEASSAFMDFSALNESYARLVSAQTDPDPGEVYPLWLAVSLALWLNWQDTT